MKFILTFICFFAIGCQSKPTKQDKAIDIKLLLEAKNNKSEIWTEYSTKDSIPQILIERLYQLSNDHFELANPKEAFQATDAILYKNLPWRQLRFLGKFETTWVMTCKHGGIGLHYHFVICKIAGNQIKFFRTGVATTDLESLNQIKKALSDQKIEFKNIEFEQEIDKA